MFSSESMRDHATLVVHLADLFDGQDIKAFEDLDFLLAILNTQHRLWDELRRHPRSGLCLAAVGCIAGSCHKGDMQRIIQLRDFLELTGTCNDEKFAQLVTNPMEAEKAARAVKPQAVTS